MRHVFYIVIVFLLFAHCSFQKRLYRKGYYVEKHFQNNTYLHNDKQKNRALVSTDKEYLTDKKIITPVNANQDECSYCLSSNNMDSNHLLAFNKVKKPKYFRYKQNAFHIDDYHHTLILSDTNEKKASDTSDKRIEVNRKLFKRMTIYNIFLSVLNTYVYFAQMTTILFDFLLVVSFPYGLFCGIIFFVTLIKSIRMSKTQNPELFKLRIKTMWMSFLGILLAVIAGYFSGANFPWVNFIALFLLPISPFNILFLYFIADFISEKL